MNNLDHIALDKFDRAYFIGIGGIGMSALARYFKAQGWRVAGYDKTPSPLTDQLVEEGIEVHFDDLGPSIPEYFRQKDKTLVVYTPAIPKNHGELLHFRHTGAHLFKRAEVLGFITRMTRGIGVAGTHGKTTTCSMLAHLMSTSEVGCNAFLGGIATNFGSNLVLHPTSQYTVMEADEFDRSFLKLDPFCSIITSDDPDHLDIYGDADYFRKGFREYASLVREEGCLVQKYGLNLPTIASNITYGINKQNADYSGGNLRFTEGKFLFDVRTPHGVMSDLELGIPGIHNAENAIACIAMLHFLGIGDEVIRQGLKTFKGVKRRFEYIIRTPELIYIDDYAHHPTEIHALVSSVRLLYPGKKVTGVFQPHLFSRTRDFFEGFAHELSQLDEVILMPIYPAREEPIPGVTSGALLEELVLPDKKILGPSEVVEWLGTRREGVILTIGAGDIDRIVEPLKAKLTQ
jgi:UDP-N-acetylmuramate--alanine ligase